MLREFISSAHHMRSATRGQQTLASSTFPPFVLLLFYALHSFIGLTYEVVWIKYLTATLGMTAPAFSVVLAMFMTGLGLGSFGLAYATKTKKLCALTTITSSLTSFAILQAGIGLLGLAFPFLLNVVDSIYSVSAPETDGIHHLLIRCLFTSLLLLPITTLLGTGFPLLAGLSTAFASKDSSQRPGRVYFVGVLASAVGALGALIMIPTWGLLMTSLLLGGLNLILAIAAYFIGRQYFIAEFSSPRYPASEAPQKRKASRNDTNSGLSPGYPMGLIVSVGGILGFLILGLEIVGAQFIWLVINATAYSEGLLFAVILLAMALGSLLYLWARAHISAFLLLVAGFLSAIIAQTALIMFAGTLAGWFDQFLHQSDWMQTWIGASSIRFFLASGALTFCVLGLPAIGYGLSFCCLCEFISAHKPPSSKPSRASRKNLSTDNKVSPLARLYAWHNSGSVIGVIVTSFVFIPWLGLTMSLTVLSGIGLVVLWIIGTAWPDSLGAPSPSSKTLPRLSIPRLSIGLMAFASLLWVGGNGDLTFRHAAAGESQEVVFQREEVSGVVEVFRNRQTGERALFTSRLRQEGSSGKEDLRVQQLQGYLPLLLHPSPRNVLTIGLGTGIAAAANLRDDIEQLTIVEISNGIVDAAAFFNQESHGILSHPKTRIIRQDGRNYVKLSRQQFDLIIQELFFPYQSGVGSLYTVEHYQRCRERLADGGMIGQWITINQLGFDDLRVLIHTFQRVFPHTSLWLHGGYLLILGGLEPLRIDFSQYAQRFAQNDPLGGIARLGTDPYDFLSRFITQGAPLKNWVSDAPLNTDDNRLIEYSAPLSFSTLNTTSLAARTLEALRSILIPVTEVVREEPGSSGDMMAHLSQVSKASALLLQGIVARTNGDNDQAESLYTRAWKHNPTNYQVQTFLEPLWAARGRTFLLHDNLSEAERWLNKALLVNTTNPNVFFDLGLLYSRQSRDREAANWYRQVLEKFPDWPKRLSALFNLGLTQYRAGHYSKAVHLFQEVVQQEPRSPDAHFNLANSFVKTGEYQQAKTHYQAVLRLDPSHQDAQDNLIEVIRWLNDTDISETS